MLDRLFVMRTVVLALVLALLPTRGFADVEGDPENVDSALTWIQWWECNRDAVIEKTLHGKHATTAPADLIGKATQPLLDATKSDSPEVRAEAALALGRIGQGKPRLLEMTKDQH